LPVSASHPLALNISYYNEYPKNNHYNWRSDNTDLYFLSYIAKIMALSEIYGSDQVARAIEDAFQFAAFSSDYIANILKQRERLTVQPGPLHLTRRQDLLDIELTPVDISIYDFRNTALNQRQSIIKNPADTALEKHLDYLKLPYLKENCRALMFAANNSHISRGKPSRHHQR
jgi:hypothetical protein